MEDVTKNMKKSVKSKELQDLLDELDKLQISIDDMALKRKTGVKNVKKQIGEFLTT